MLHIDVLTRLVAERGGDQVSLFLPTRRGLSGARRNRARFDDLLRLRREVRHVVHVRRRCRWRRDASFPAAPSR